MKVKVTPKGRGGVSAPYFVISVATNDPATAFRNAVKEAKANSRLADFAKSWVFVPDIIYT